MEENETESSENDKLIDSNSFYSSEIELTNRLNAYFIIALYSIIDRYSLIFYRESERTVPNDQYYTNVQKSKKRKDTPKSLINSGLELLKLQQPEVIELRTKLVNSMKWNVHQDSFSKLMVIRNNLALNPSTKLPILSKAYSILSKLAR